MNPQMMAQAQEMMAKMSPEDIRRMQEMTRNLDPNMMRTMQQQMASNPQLMAQAQAHMANLTPEQLRAQMAEAANLTPEQMRMQAEMSARMAGVGLPPATPAAPKSAADALRASPVSVPPGIVAQVDDAERLKANGNKRFAAQDYDGAIAKYDAALAALTASGYEAELTAANLAAVNALADICLVNSATCQLKKGMPARAVDACSRVLARSPAHRKALYNRGKALLAQGDLSAAVSDLKSAHRADTSDATVLAALRDAKAARRAAAAASHAEGMQIADADADSDSDADDAHTGTSAVAPAGPGGMAGGFGGASMPGLPPGMSASDMEQAQRAMMNMTPEQLSAQMEMISKMDPAFLQSVDPRFKDMPPEMMKASLEAAKSLRPEQLRQMQQQMAAGGGAGAPLGAGGGALAGAPGMAAGLAGGAGGLDMAAAAGMMDNLSPEAMASMSNMMASMDPEAMAKMMSAMGRTVSPDEAKKMQEQLAKVSPETMHRWLGRAAKALKMFNWLKAAARDVYAQPRRSAMQLVSAGTPLARLTAALTALLAALILGHVTSLF